MRSEGEDEGEDEDAVNINLLDTLLDANDSVVVLDGSAEDLPILKL